jgi:D-xylose 1-dehydrogenase (NADP+, D-xylono-1,5-lactone-forming)
MGVIGAGGIAKAFAGASKSCKSVQVTAIGSRDQSKADAFAAEFGLAKAYGSYRDLIQDPEIDAVYIATPNSVHTENAIAAAEAGQHILFGKPMATSPADAMQMFDAADENNVVLVEGFPFRFQRQTIEVLTRLAAGDFGNIVTIAAGFGFTLKDPLNPRWDPDLGGGAIWDVGVYPLNLVRAAMGSAPVRVSAAAKVTDLDVDITTSALLEYADGRAVTIWCSFESLQYRRAQIIASDAVVDFSYNNHFDDEPSSRYNVLTKEGANQVSPGFGNGFALEAEAFARVVAEGAPEGTCRKETLDNTATAEAILRSARSGNPEEIETP